MLDPQNKGNTILPARRHGNISHKELIYRMFNFFIIQMIKGKAIPLQAWTRPEGSRRFRFPYFKTIST
jgi:hypothetical protein